MRNYDEVLRDHVKLVTRAADFAARRHIAQRRKGAAQEPYINHLSEVACLLAETTEEPDAVLVAAGWLHDTLEDTSTTKAELEAFFGPQVAGIVTEVSDDKSLQKHERKQLQIKNARGKSQSARLIKVADKTSNLRSLASSPPADWSAERMATYVDWAEQVVASCRGLNVHLEEAFDLAASEARVAIAKRSRLVGA